MWKEGWKGHGPASSAHRTDDASSVWLPGCCPVVELGGAATLPLSLLGDLDMTASSLTVCHAWQFDPSGHAINTGSLLDPIFT